MPELTLADHAEAWAEEHALPIPARYTEEWWELYEKWHAFAFEDFLL